LTKTTSSNNNGKKDNNNKNSYQHEGETQKREPSAATYRILLVDDDSDILLTFKEGLEEEHDVDKSRLFDGAKIQVDTFADPKKALSSFKAGVYDLLLLDIRMQDMNGFELYEELKKIDDVGCFIKKPISIEDLATKISEELA
jgi:CheY-like chemotaxis protein